LTAACCPKRDFYTPSPPHPLKTATDFCTAYLKEHVFCTAYSKKHTRKQAQKSRQKKVIQKNAAKNAARKVGKKFIPELVLLLS